MSWLTAAVEWQSRAVVTRHLRVYVRNWHTAFLPPALEPVTMLLAFGLGLGGYVASLTWQGRPIEYMSYVAPGLLAPDGAIVLGLDNPRAIAGLVAIGFAIRLRTPLAAIASGMASLWLLQWGLARLA